MNNMDQIFKRLGYGIIGAILGGSSAYMVLIIWDKTSWGFVMIVSVLSFLVAFFGGKQALTYLVHTDDYIP
jgi:hypothetical protein